MDIIHDLITNVLLRHILHIRNGDIGGTESEITKTTFCDKHCKCIVNIFKYQALNVWI